MALVDTGATESCIDNLLAATLKLPIVNRREVSGSAGKHVANVYLAQVHVPTLAFTIYGAFAGVELAAGGQSHSLLNSPRLRLVCEELRMGVDEGQNPSGHGAG
jgi:hypothetical protein